jgi:PIN domain nuclease of toxin-antitoxin system
MNDDIPTWAIELIKQVERLNEKIPTHIDWVERNMKDHEIRIRSLERKIWIAVGAGAVIGGFAGSLSQALGA